MLHVTHHVLHVTSDRTHVAHYKLRTTCCSLWVTNFVLTIYDMLCTLQHVLDVTQFERCSMSHLQCIVHDMLCMLLSVWRNAGHVLPCMHNMLQAVWYRACVVIWVSSRLWCIMYGQCILGISRHVLWIMHDILPIAAYAWRITYCIFWSVHPVIWSMYTAWCIMSRAWCPTNNVYYVLCELYAAPRTVYHICCIVHCVLCTMHSVCYGYCILDDVCCTIYCLLRVVY